MKHSTLLALPALMLGVSVLTSCHRDKAYTITGIVDIPAEIDLGDTVMSIPSVDGSWVYLQDINGEPFDSTMVTDGQFTFSGTVRSGEEYFANIFGMYFSDLVAIEGGDIIYHFSNIERYVEGTPANECLTQAMSAMTMYENITRSRAMSLIDSIQAITDHELSDEEISSHLEPLYQEFMAERSAIYDTLYEDNIDNIGSIFVAVRRHLEEAESTDAFLEAINAYPERVSQHSFTLSCVEMLRAQESEMMFADPEDNGAFAE